MMTKILAVISLLLIFSCNDINDYLKHDLEYEKVGDCKTTDPGMDIVANTVGERYSFYECLNEDYNGDYSVERNGDTVVVELNKKAGSEKLFKIVLDINTRPEYRFVSINGSVFPVLVKRY